MKYLIIFFLLSFPFLGFPNDKQAQILAKEEKEPFDVAVEIEKSAHPLLTLLKKGIFMDFRDIQIKKSGIGQFKDGLGAFAKRAFKKGEVVIKWNLSILTDEEYKKLSKYEQENFCHMRDNIIYYYPDPERHVNRSKNPNVVPDFEKEANIALCDIKKGEELSIPESIKEDF